MTRRELDAYQSPEIVGEWLTNHWGTNGNDRVLECCVGEGSIAKHLYNYGCKVHTNDIDPSVKADYHFDVRYQSAWEHFPQIDWVITNPPFSSAINILENAFLHANVGVCFFLRKTFTEPTFHRQNWLHDHQDHLRTIINCPRISFTGDGKVDNVSSDWFIWTKYICSTEIYFVKKPLR